MDGLFEVVFDGKIMPNRQIDDVKAALAQLFKSTPATIEKLFCGQPIAIKKSVDYQSALRYIGAMKEAGALARLRQMEGVAAPKPAAPTVTQWVVAPVGTALGEKPLPKIPRTIDTSHLSLAPVGAQMGEHQDFVPAQLDLAEYALAPVGSDMGEAKEYIPLPEPDLSDYSLAQVGVILGSPRTIEPVHVGDISAITIAPVGAQLDVTEKPAPPPPPSTDHLKLG